MSTLVKIVLRTAVTLVFTLMPKTTLAQDLSRYRDFQFGADLSTVVKQAGEIPSQAKVVQSRPSLIQELPWRPRPLGATTRAEPVKDVTFSFYDGALFRIVVNYDRYETEGMTRDDFIESISAAYGTAAKPTAPIKVVSPAYEDQEEIVAQWQDAQYRYDLIRSAYGPSFRLVGVVKAVEGPVQASIVEAARLDLKEAPQREADRVVEERDAERVRLEKARLVNKPKFRP